MESRPILKSLSYFVHDANLLISLAKLALLLMFLIGESPCVISFVLAGKSMHLIGRCASELSQEIHE